MKIQRLGLVASVALVGSIALTACGSDDNAGSPGASSSSTTTSACPKGGTLNGEGSSAQKNAIEEAISSFQDECAGTTINYNPTGSGAGIKQFTAGQVDFAGSDSALKTVEKDGVVESDAAAKFCGSPAWNLPMVTGPIALAYNIAGVDSLTLTPSVLAGIFNGKITNWNDPAIAALNSGVTLPALGIQAVHRAEDSGTTENFTKYLKAAAPSDWTIDPSKSWTAPGGVAAQGSDGVAKQVKSTDGSIGYVEWGFAIDDGLNVAQIDNGGGAVELTAESAGKAVAAATVVGTGKDLALKLDYATKAPGAYPVILVTYEIVCSAGNADLGPLLKSFLGYTATDGQTTLADLGAAPLPAEIQTKVIDSVTAIS